VRVVHLSDTHGFPSTCPVPAGNVLIHTGDFCRHVGTEREYADFNDALGRWDHPHKLVVIGNHDVYGRGDTALMARMLPNATHVFDAEEIVVCGLRIFGLSYHQSLLAIPLPAGLDLLLTHEPPLGILDVSVSGKKLGDKHLKEKIQAARPRYHLFGHIHEDYGAKELRWSDGKTTRFFNGAQADHHTLGLVNAPRVIDIIPQAASTGAFHHHDIVALGRDGCAPRKPRVIL